MNYILRGAQVLTRTGFSKMDIMTGGGRILAIAPTIPFYRDTVSFDFNSFHIFPGLLDVHVHLREPGFFYKETIASGTAAAARGGFTTVLAMPNLLPVPDCAENLARELEIIRRGAVVRVVPYGAITVREEGAVIADLESMSPDVAAFSDDGRGVQSARLMREAMRRAKALGRIVAAHCEDMELTAGGYINDGEYARKNGHRGIPSQSEWRQIERDLALAEETGCAYHVCHVSCRESVELIRRAKERGIDVTCETAPHYLILSDDMLKDEGRFKMNPPIRSADDRAALIEGIKDGTVDIIATDHAPHGEEEKSGGLRGSLMGIVGLETAFPELYTNLVMPGTITLEKLLNLLFYNPRGRFGIGSELAQGERADLTVFNLGAKYKIDPAEFLSLGKSTPFEGDEVYGRCVLTMAGGEIVWRDGTGDSL